MGAEAISSPLPLERRGSFNQKTSNGLLALQGLPDIDIPAFKEQLKKDLAPLKDARGRAGSFE